MKTIAVNNASRLFGTAGVYFGVEGPSRPLLPVPSESVGVRFLSQPSSENSIPRVTKAREASTAIDQTAVENSLRRFETEWIDLYQLRVPDPSRPWRSLFGSAQELVDTHKCERSGTLESTWNR